LANTRVGTKPFLILQLRPEAEASDNEFEAICLTGGLEAGDVERIRLERQDIPADLDPREYAGGIVGGGPGCVSDPPGAKTPTEARIEEQILSLMPRIVEQDVPFMGCCYGIGILAHHLGARVSKERYGEGVGAVSCSVTQAGLEDPLLRDLPEQFLAFVGHKEAVQELPPACVHLIESEPCPFQMIRCGQNVYATQFHPEADSDVFEVRIRIYKDKGYFPPEDADRLIAMCRAQDVGIPKTVLRRFVERYRPA